MSDSDENFGSSEKGLGAAELGRAFSSAPGEFPGDPVTFVQRYDWRWKASFPSIWKGIILRERFHRGRGPEVRAPPEEELAGQ